MAETLPSDHGGTIRLCSDNGKFVKREAIQCKKVKVMVLHPVQQPESYWYRSTALSLSGAIFM